MPRKVVRKQKVLKPRVPRTRNAGTMTEAAFFGWIRSQLRKMSQRWKPIYECRRKGRRLVTDLERGKWGNRITYVNACAICQAWFPDKFLQVDHNPECGSIGTNEEDFKVMAGPWILRLLAEGEHLRLLCHECHHKVTQA